MLAKEVPSPIFWDKAAENPAKPGLISSKRSQKLELVIHLLTNLQQNLIVCGPAGIGKSTLLQTLKTQCQDVWGICLLAGNRDLNFEAIIIKLNQFLNTGNPKPSFDIGSLRSYCEKRQVVLIIDDAGELAPGLVSQLINLTRSLSEFRIVFSMTYDAFHIKRATDKAIDDCYLIELPPLDIKECADYLQNLSARSLISLNSVTDSLIEDLYQASHGIPGRILAEIPRFKQARRRKQVHKGLWLSLLIIGLLIGITLYVLMSNTAPDKLGFQTAQLKIPLPNPVALANQPTAVTTQPLTTVKTQDAEITPLKIDAPVSTRPDSLTAQSPVNQTLPEIKTEKPTHENSHQNWIMQQPAENYTLQVSVLSNIEAVNRFLTKYAELGDSLTYFMTGNNNKIKYVIIYGSFQTLADAKAYKAIMPKEFNSSLERKFKFVQTENSRL